MTAVRHAFSLTVQNDMVSQIHHGRGTRSKEEEEIHTLLALLDRRDAVLELGNVPPDPRRRARRVDIFAASEHAALARGLDVEPRGEGALAGGRDDDGAVVRVVRDLVHERAQLEPHGLDEGVELLGPVDLDAQDVGRRGADDIVFRLVALDVRHRDGVGVCGIGYTCELVRVCVFRVM